MLRAPTGFARLAYRAFYFAIPILIFCKIIKVECCVAAIASYFTLFLNSLFCGAKINMSQLRRRPQTHRWPSGADAPVDIKITVFHAVKTPQTGIQ